MSTATEQGTPPRVPPAPPGDGAGRRRPISITRLVLGGLLVLLGLAWLAESTGLLTIHWQTVLSVAVLGVGAVLLLGGHRAERDGLIALGVVLSALLLIVSLTPRVPLGSGVGDRVHRPSTMAELEASYDLGAGNLLLDLRELTLDPGTTEVTVSIGAGELVVRLPEDVAVDVEARSGIGEVDVLGRTAEGFGPSVAAQVPGGGRDARLVLDLSTGAGSIEVTR